MNPIAFYLRNPVRPRLQRACRPIPPWLVLPVVALALLANGYSGASREIASDPTPSPDLIRSPLATETSLAEQSGVLAKVQSTFYIRAVNSDCVSPGSEPSSATYWGSSKKEGYT